MIKFIFLLFIFTVSFIYAENDSVKTKILLDEHIDTASVVSTDSSTLLKTDKLLKQSMPLVDSTIKQSSVQNDSLIKNIDTLILDSNIVEKPKKARRKARARRSAKRQKLKIKSQKKKYTIEKEEVLYTYKGDKNERFRSPKFAFLLSFMIPGAGEIYGKASIPRIVAPAIMEIAGWTSMYLIAKRGDELRINSENWVDDNFSRERYEKFVKKFNDNNGDTSLVSGSSAEFSHSLPTTNTSDFYEMVTKYDQFTQGWDDVDPDLLDPLNPDILAIKSSSETETIYLYYHNDDNNRPRYYGLSENQLEGMRLREVMNSQYDNRIYPIIGILALRLVSGLNAIMAANTHNKSLLGAEIAFIDHISLDVYSTDKSSSLFTYNALKVNYRF